MQPPKRSTPVNTPFVVAAFDFDGTITTTDSLQAFLRHTIGRTRFSFGILRSLPWLAACGLRLIGRGPAKARLMRATIGGWTESALDAAAQRFVDDTLPALLRPEMLERVHQHRALGHHVVLVSASPTLYLERWGQSVGFDAVIATEIGYRLDGQQRRCFAGDLATPNCWGPEKVNRLHAWWGERSPDRLYVYGDSRGDREMAALTLNAWIRGQGDLPALSASLPLSSPTSV